ncbi:MAG TPA: hypothetical protein VFV01_39180 [Spirillospora sp.]|nr:hypothetical protein [Spirillospora sp.]
MDFIELVIDRPLPEGVDRDDVEDDLNEALAGRGEVSGAGTGLGSSNLDIDVDPAADREEALGAVFEVLARLQVGDAVRIRPGDGVVWIRLSGWTSSSAR